MSKMTTDERYRVPRRARGERELRAGDESCFSGSKIPPKKAQAKEEACYIPQNQTLRQGLERLCRFPRPCRRVMWRITLAREFTVRQAMPCNATHSLCKSHRIGQLATERVLPIV